MSVAVDSAQHAIAPADRMVSDMRFVAIYTIVIGALACLSIVGAIIGVPLIIAGLRLRDAAGSFSNYTLAGETAMLAEAFERQKTYFTIHKWIIIASLVFAVVGIVLSIAGTLAMFGSLM